jgi:EmrB/QacA subfamily drug resistance transporter
MTRTERLTLVATILGSAIVFLDATVVNVALPAIEEDLNTDLAGQQWVVEAYMLTLTAFLLVGGSLGDLYGRRRLFVIGLSGFAVTSVLCAIAPSVELLIAFRALQGIAGALLVPGSLAILAATFEGEARGRAIGIWTAWAGISTLIGPAGGGLLVELDWRWIFWLNLPLIAATLVITRHSVAESRDPEACAGIDYIGIALSAVGLGGPVFALIEQPTHGWGDPLVAIPLVAGIASLIAFVLWEARARAPMMPLGLYRSHNFSAVNLATLCVYGGLYGVTFFITLFLQQVADYSPFEAGLATTPITVIMFVLSSRFGALAGRIGPRLLMGVGPLLCAVGVALLLRVEQEGAYVSTVLPALLPFGLGLAMTVAPLTTTVLNSVAERHAGVASGINNAVARVAGLLAIAALGAIISAQFASALDDTIGERQLGVNATEAVADAKEQPLAGGAKGVPGSEGERLDAEVTSSSVSAFHLGMGVGAGLLALGGAIALVGVRNPERPPRPEHAPGAAATAGDCGHPSQTGEPSPVPGSLSPEPAPTGIDSAL